MTYQSASCDGGGVAEGGSSVASREFTSEEPSEQRYLDKLTSNPSRSCISSQTEE